MMWFLNDRMQFIIVFGLLTLVADASSTEPFEVHAIVGEPLQLTCSRHKPSDKILWKHNGTQLRQSHRVQVSEEILKITRVRLSDSGVYSCVAGNEDKTPVLVTIQDLVRPAVVLDHPSDVKELHPSGDLSLRCDCLSKSDDIAYHWFKNGVKLSKSTRVDLKRGHITLKNLTINDNGMYSCSVHVRGRTEDSMDSFALFLPATNIPQLLIAPKSQIVSVGSTARFECYFESSNVTWHQIEDERLLEVDERTKIENGVLTIDKITYADEGIYACAPDLKQDGRPVYAAKLTVARLHQMTDSSFDPPLSESHIFNVPQGNFMEISCLSNRHDKPRPNITWYHRAKQLPKVGPSRQEGDTLIIESVENQNGGIYYCHIENLAGKHKTMLFVFVIPHPKFLNPPKRVETLSGIPQICQFSSENIWPVSEELLRFWNDTSVFHAKRRRHHKITPSHHFNDLTVRVANKEGKGWSGELMLEYKVHVLETWNNASDRFIESTLRRIDSAVSLSDYTKVENNKEVLWCRSVWTPRPSTRTLRAATPDELKFAPAPFNKKLGFNTTGKILCKATGNPMPNITWFKNEQDSLPSEAVSMNGTLTFNPALKEHRGNYTCVASNNRESINATIFVDVVVSPRVIWPTQDLSMRGTVGDDIWLNCKAEGDPKPTIHWDKNLLILNGNSSLNMSRYHIYENGSLLIKNATYEDSDRYSCTAGSAAGLDRHDMNLIMADVDSGVGNTAVIVSVCVAAAYMILALALMYYCRRKKSNTDKPETNELEPRNEDRDKLMQVEEGNTSNEQRNNVKNKSSDRLKAKNGHVKRNDGEQTGGDSATAKSDNSAVSANSKRAGNPPNQYDALSMSRSVLTECVLLGRGEFGDVILAKLDYRKLKNHNIPAPESAINPVMIKSLTGREQSDCAEFKRQLDMFYKVKNENLASVVGICNEMDPHYLVFEYSDWGDFKQYLQSTQTEHDEEVYRQKLGAKLAAELIPAHRQAAKELTETEALSLVKDLAEAANALANNRYVHRDIAARNCIISSKLSLKLSIPALTKSAYAHEYYKHNNRIIPLRWSPNEVITEEDYSCKSDVYMFGVTVWEIYNKGELPFAKLNDTSVLNQLKNDSLKWQHSDRTPQDVRQLIDSCLNASPRDRPNFDEILNKIAGMLIDL